MSTFRYSLNSSTIRTTPLLQKIEVAAAAGYEGIELWHNDLDEFVESGGALDDVRRRLDDLGLSVPTTIHLKEWFQATGDDYQHALLDVQKKMAQAAAVGAPFVVAGPPAGVADRQRGSDHYRDLLKLGRQTGVRPAFEYLGFVQDIRTIDDAIDIIDGSGDPDATIVLDPFHCWVGGGGMGSIARLTAAQVAVSHFNDAPAMPVPATQRDPDRVMPGDGVVDLTTYCRLLKQIGYCGFLSLELFRPDLWAQDPLQVARTGLRKMRAIAEAV